MHIFHFPATLTETASVTKTAHTVRTEPTVAAKFFLRGIMAFITAKTVIPIVYITILASITFLAIVRQLVTGSALATVRR